MPILSSPSFLDLSRLNSDRGTPIPGASSDATQASGPSPFQRMLDLRSDEQLQRSQSDDGTQSQAARQASGRQADDAGQDASSNQVKAQQTSSGADRAARPTQGATSGHRADSAQKDAPKGPRKGATTDRHATQQARQAQGDQGQGSDDAKAAAADGAADSVTTADALPATTSPRGKAAAEVLTADAAAPQVAHPTAPDASGAAPDAASLMAALQGQTSVHAATAPAPTAVDGKGAGEAILALHRLPMAQTGRSFLGDPAGGAGAPTSDVGGASPSAALNPFAAIGGDSALAAATDTKAHPAFQDLLSGQTGAQAAADAATPDLAAMGIAAAAAGAPAAHVAGGAGADQAAAGVPQYGIDAPVGTAGFATALGDRLTWMVKDGQTQAQLKLNPEQLGPIVVEIQMQGAMAHVNFVAAHDATRAAIESSMSQLASALQSEGLSLGGTNVQAQTQQHGQGRSDDAPAPDAGRGVSGRDTEIAVSAAAPRARTARANGVLDLYA